MNAILGEGVEAEVEKRTVLTLGKLLHMVNEHTEQEEETEGEEEEGDEGSSPDQKRMGENVVYIIT